VERHRNILEENRLQHFDLPAKCPFFLAGWRGAGNDAAILWQIRRRRLRGAVSSRAKIVNYVRPFWNAFREAGWPGSWPEALRSGGRGGKVAKRRGKVGHFLRIPVLGPRGGNSCLAVCAKLAGAMQRILFDHNPVERPASKSVAGLFVGVSVCVCKTRRRNATHPIRS
jgi:hypothetical protein